MIAGQMPTRWLFGQVETLFEAAFVQFDSVVAGQNSDVELPWEAGANLVDHEDSLNVGQGLRRRDVVDSGKPGKGALSVPGLNRQPHVLDLVAPRTKAKQTIKALN